MQYDTFSQSSALSRCLGGAWPSLDDSFGPDSALYQRTGEYNFLLHFQALLITMVLGEWQEGKMGGKSGCKEKGKVRRQSPNPDFSLKSFMTVSKSKEVPFPFLFLPPTNREVLFLGPQNSVPLMTWISIWESYTLPTGEVPVCVLLSLLLEFQSDSNLESFSRREVS